MVGRVSEKHTYLKYNFSSSFNLFCWSFAFGEGLWLKFSNWYHCSLLFLKTLYIYFNISLSHYDFVQLYCVMIVLIIQNSTLFTQYYCLNEYVTIFDWSIFLLKIRILVIYIFMFILISFVFYNVFIINIIFYSNI